MTQENYIALLGGSFNPPHIAHFRIAQEVFEALSPKKLFFIPCATPPHKQAKNLLPFTLRAEMLLQSLIHFPHMNISTIEQKRSGPSYTVDTLEELTRTHPDHRLLFILGQQDLEFLPTWERWQHLLTLADLAILPRSCSDSGKDIEIKISALWPDKVFTQTVENELLCFTAESKERIWHLQQPILGINSSLIRQRWLNNHSIQFLVPDPVNRLMSENAVLAREVWYHTPKEQLPTLHTN